MARQSMRDGSEKPVQHRALRARGSDMDPIGELPYGPAANGRPHQRPDIAAPGTRAIQGSYQGQSVTHFVDPQTGLNVIRDSSGNLLSGWKLSPKQLEYVLTTGKLGGGL
ncbi:colicin D domain-containing protein [Mesorhizobium sp. M0323]|uniref:colicin D domain-containing protein n=1 Tax=Mesorhizobium sp. M0323 TaxID=2956938 RepID=UPI00333BAE53